MRCIRRIPPLAPADPPSMEGHTETVTIDRRPEQDISKVAVVSAAGPLMISKPEKLIGEVIVAVQLIS
jgi:hypothetical protein